MLCTPTARQGSSEIPRGAPWIRGRPLLFRHICTNSVFIDIPGVAGAVLQTASSLTD